MTNDAGQKQILLGQVSDIEEMNFLQFSRHWRLLGVEIEGVLEERKNKHRPSHKSIQS